MGLSGQKESDVRRIPAATSGGILIPQTRSMKLQLRTQRHLAVRSATEYIVTTKYLNGCPQPPAASTEDQVVFGHTSSSPASNVAADTRPFCNYCSKRFGSREALKQHIDNVASHPVRKCCGRRFVSESAYESHARAKHWT